MKEKDISDEGIQIGEVVENDPDALQTAGRYNAFLQSLGIPVPQVPVPREEQALQNKKEQKEQRTHIQRLLEDRNLDWAKVSRLFVPYVRELCLWAEGCGINLPTPHDWKFGIYEEEQNLICTAIDLRQIERQINTGIFRPDLRPASALKSATLTENLVRIQHIVDYDVAKSNLGHRKVVPVAIDGFLAFVVAPRH